MLAATFMAPGHDKVIPLEREFIVPQVGQRSRIARIPPPRAGWPNTGSIMWRWTRFISATIYFPVSRFAKR